MPSLKESVALNSPLKSGPPGGAAAPAVKIELRKYPFPYDAMLAICSDLDETPDRQVYFEIAKFLNTTATTTMGPGVGLEVGNSIYFDMPPDQYSYWGTDEYGREMARALMHSGHIDCLHSYGDLATGRRHIERDIDELTAHGCKLEVWVDHSKAPSNFGPDIMVGSGDVAGSPAYHADLTLAYGIRYVWRGRTTGVTGQDVPVGFGAVAQMFNAAHPIVSTRTLAKEAAKVWLGRRSHPRWEMYGANRVCRASRLRDGRQVWEFLRSNPYLGGPGGGATADGIGQVLTGRMLDRLLDRRGACVLYTHLGKVSNPNRPFGDAAVQAFRRLAALRDAGRILVTTTHRLLRYVTTRDTLRYRAWRQGQAVIVAIESIQDPLDGPRDPHTEELQGLTFEIPRSERVEVWSGGPGSPAFTLRHEGDTTLVSLPWHPLCFPVAGDAEVTRGV